MSKKPETPTEPIAEDPPAKPEGEHQDATRVRGYRNPEAEEFVAVDFDALEDMIERKNTAVLDGTFGGVEGLAKALHSDSEKGFDPSTVDARMAQFGENILQKQDPVTFWPFLLEAFEDRVVQILCVAAVISIVFGMTLKNPHTDEVERSTGWIEGTAIVISVLVVTLTGSINNFVKAKQFERMEREQNIRQLSVERGGQRLVIDSNLLCVGDVLHIEAGMEMTCDGVVTKAVDLKTNESAITGESETLEKTPKGDDPFVISGSLVDEGHGICLVTAVGMGSLQGRLKKSIDEDDTQTPLQEHLDDLANKISIFAFAGALLLVLALSIKEVIKITTDDKSATAISFLNFILIAITLIAVAIPEGLPLAVTIALGFGMQAMMKENCLVRVLASCETMGAATAICSDKTGTLTTNHMTVVQGCVGDHEFVVEGFGLHRRTVAVTEVQRDSQKLSKVSEKLMSTMGRALAINSTAHESVVDGETQWVGNKTEQGMLQWLRAVGVEYATLRGEVEAARLRQYPFSSQKKRMTSIVRTGPSAGTLYCKGASETILATCPKYMTASGTIADLTKKKLQEFNAVIEDMANQGNRTIGVAFQPCQLGAKEFPAEEPEPSELVFLGVLGIQDPIRPEVPEAVAQCTSAGIRVRMVTGDNINTAVAIGKKCGIYRDNGFDLAMTGIEFRERLADDEAGLLLDLPRLCILARSSPSDKHTLVGLLQRLDEVVGVTGDGTNDAPALKLAQVGFAMNSGTDIAKGASEMVIRDDNFATVVTAVRWGRAVNDSIRKFLQFQLAINVAGVSITAIGSLASETSKEPFTPVQLLWLNLIMDTLAALSLATEKPEDASLARRPSYSQAPFITRRMLGFVGIHGVFQIIVILLMLFMGHNWFDTIDDRSTCADAVPNTTVFEHCRKECEDEGGIFKSSTLRCQQGKTHSTMIFNTFIWFQIFNVINGRKIHGEFNPFEGVWARSKQLLVIFTLIAFLQFLAVHFGGRFLSTTKLRARDWGITVAIAISELLVGCVQRVLPIQDYVPESILEKEREEAELRKKYAKDAEAPEVVAEY